MYGYHRCVKQLADRYFSTEPSGNWSYRLLGFWVAWCAAEIRAAWELMRARLHPHRRLSPLRRFREEIERERGIVIRQAIWGPKIAASMRAEVSVGQARSRL